MAAALNKGGWAQERGPLNPCLEKGSLFPLPFPRQASSGRNHLKKNTRETGDGERGWPGSSFQLLPPQQSQFLQLPLQPRPSRELRGRNKSFLSRLVHIQIQLSPDPQRVTPLRWFHPGRRGNTGLPLCDTLSFPRRPRPEGKTLGSLLGHGPPLFSLPR